MSRRRTIPFANPRRRTALTRAGVAIAAALALLVAVLWFEDSGPSTAESVRTPDVPKLDAPLQTEDAFIDSEAPVAAAEAPPVPEPETPATDISPTPEAAPAAKAPAPTPLPDGYFVQLGVFDATENADKLLDNVNSLGLPAHLQARVVVGPFLNKREAEAARKRLRDVAEGIVLPPRKAAQASAKRSAKSQRRTK